MSSKAVPESSGPRSVIAGVQGALPPRRYIQYVLERTGNRISGSGGAAEVLDMDRATLYHRMKKLGLR